MSSVDSKTEAKAQQKLARTSVGQRLLRRRTIWRIAILLGLLIGLGLFLSWLTPASRSALILGVTTNQLLIAFLLAFSLVAVSLLWSVGQRLDLWVFQLFNLRGYHSLWMDRAMWLTTQMGTGVLAGVVAAVAYVSGNQRFAIQLMLGTMTLWLLVELLKAATDRARPFNLLRETRIIGARAPGLSFPSGHTAQTFFLMSLTIIFFQLPSPLASALYAGAALVGFTRIYVGAHYPRDVFAGAVLGLVWSILSTLIATFV